MVFWSDFIQSVQSPFPFTCGCYKSTAELGLDNNRIDFNDKEDWSQQEKIVQEIGHILKKMNATGQTAVLRHANELSKIPDYQKKEH